MNRADQHPPAGAGRRPAVSAAILLIALLWMPGAERAAAAQSGATADAAPAPTAGTQRRDYSDAAMRERRSAVMARERSQWPAEIHLRRITPKLEQFLAALQAGSFDAPISAALFAPRFRGSAVPASTADEREANGVRWEVLDTRGLETVAAEAFRQQWGDYAAEYTAIARTEYQVGAVHITPDAEPVARLKVHFRLTGTAGEQAREDRGVFAAEFLRDGDNAAWRMRAFELTSLERVFGRRQFADVTDRLGLTDSAAADSLHVAYFSQGVALADYDADGDLDLFVPRRYADAVLYRNDGRGNFEDVTKAMQLNGLAGVRAGYFFDFDNDGDLDLLAVTSQRMLLGENTEAGFVNVSAESGLDRLWTGGLTGAAVADYDGDGRLDFYVCNYGNPANSPTYDYFDSTRGFQNKLYHNQGGGRFRDVTDEAGLGADNSRWTFAALWIDYDRDGAMDLYVVNDYGPNQLFRNDGEGGFEDVAAGVGVEDYGNGMGASWADYDNDGDMDLYVSNMHSYTGERVLNSSDYRGEPQHRSRALRFAKGNTLLRNDGSGHFDEVEATPTINAKWAWGNLFFDYDNDGDQDLYVANGMFTNASTQDVGPVFWRHILAPVSRGDDFYRQGAGYLGDLIRTRGYSFAGYEHNRFYQNFGDGRLVDVGAVLGVDFVEDSRAVVAGDIDADGDLDLVVASRNRPRLRLLENRVPAAGNHLAVRTRGERSNRQGIGTRLTLECDGKRQTRVIQLGEGFVSQSDQTAWFGLGDCGQVDVLRVEWPSGQSQTFNAVAVNRTLLVTEGESRLHLLRD